MATFAAIFVARGSRHNAVKLSGYLHLLVGVQVTVRVHRCLYLFMSEPLRDQQRREAHLHQQAGVAVSNVMHPYPLHARSLAAILHFVVQKALGVEKKILWSKRCKDKSLVGTVKETIQQVSMSKKWDSKPALGEHGKPLLNANGKTVLRKSYSVLQDDFFAAMRKAGYDDVERGERGSSEEHLTVTQFKVQQEQARLAEFTEQNRQQEKQAATLGSKIEKIQNQRVDVRSIEKIVATSIPFSPKVAVEREDFDRLSTLAKKYVTAEKKESKLQKALDAANKLIAKLKAEIDGLKQEISDYKSVRGKLRAAELERENTELRGKVRSYEDVIQRNNLWRFFHPHREKAVTRDEAR